MSSIQATKKRWALRRSGGSTEEFLAEIAWVANSGALVIGNHVDEVWIPDAVFNVGEWATCASDRGRVTIRCRVGLHAWRWQGWPGWSIAECARCTAASSGARWWQWRVRCAPKGANWRDRS